ncbi:glycosyltransferase family 4 protein [Pseudarthrobacter sp. NCCP-2145]|uniref:glycosyltransferase family 4 protein n=1 Tax=Pseudarthrobacter sp. NCCP-2145 TaxID=2942290 RepID=UPI00203BD34A|nr:glycosyltransferase family 4 protein [Pseudarthrobacter sp. NCCP-2145]
MKRVEISVLPEADVGLSRTERLVKVLRGARALSNQIPRTSIVIVLGLGAVHMLALSTYLRFSSLLKRTVVYDVCDSWVLQSKSRMSGSFGLVTPALLGVVMQATVGRLVLSSYISERDAKADRFISRGSGIFVIGPAAPAELHEALPLPVVVGPIQRLVVSADYEAFHNDRGLGMLAEAWGIFHAEHPGVQLHLYGKGKPPEIPGATSLGWAKEMKDVYAGNTLVFIPNVSGSGVPNKLVDALTANRPILVHSSIADVLDEHALIQSYDDSASLLNLLRSVCSQDFDFGESKQIFPTSELPSFLASGLR